MICKSTIARKIILLTLALFLFAPFSFLFAQTTVIAPRVIATPVKKVSRVIKMERDEDTTAEKSIVVDAKVKVQLCVSEGKLKINGWERNEIRAFVSDGNGIGFTVQQKGGQNGTPVWVKVLGFSSAKNRESGADECLSGEEIELDVPRGATIDVTSRESETTIDSVRRVKFETLEGDIFLSNVVQGIEAKTFEGDITVENSSGAMTLNTTTGNIVALGVNSSEIGDAFSAKTTSGAILLQRIEHRQTEAVSGSGSIKFVGNFQNGGQYVLRTQNGSISLLLPEKSSFRLNASFGFGAFKSEILLENVVKSVASNAQSLSASVGKAEATIVLKTSSGAIRISKQ